MKHLGRHQPYQQALWVFGYNNEPQIIEIGFLKNESQWWLWFY